MTSVDDGWPYAVMQNTDIGLSAVVNRSVCPVKYGTDGTEPRMQPGPAVAGAARPRRILRLSTGFLCAWPGFRRDLS